ncbi:hypothetical protein SMICM304S_06959 [Streptomyces microflavus]
MMREELPGYTGKVVLVVGSSRGLGRRVAELMAAQGARVIINSASTAVDGRIVARSIKSAGGQASYIGADVSCEDQVAAMAELVREKFGRLDIVVHCAAGGPEARVMDATLPMFERTFSVNSYSLVTLARHLSPLMPAGSRFVYMSSMGASPTPQTRTRSGAIARGRRLAEQQRTCGCAVAQPSNWHRRT